MRQLTLVAIALAASATAACAPSAEEVDRLNDELLASVSVYPGATLTESYRYSDPLGGRHLVHVYAASGGSTEIIDFYAHELEVEGFEPGVRASFHRGREIVFLVFPPQPLADDVETTPVASVPPGAVTFFSVDVCC